jgi:hypothetical protein
MYNILQNLARLNEVLKETKIDAKVNAKLNADEDKTRQKEPTTTNRPNITDGINNIKCKV